MYIQTRTIDTQPTPRRPKVSPKFGADPDVSRRDGNPAGPLNLPELTRLVRDLNLPEFTRLARDFLFTMSPGEKTTHAPTRGLHRAHEPIHRRLAQAISRG